MKKLILLLVLLPCLCLARCPTMVKYRISCRTATDNVVLYLHDIDTEYNVASPECEVNDPRIIDANGDFRCSYIAEHYCHLQHSNYWIKVSLVMGMNWIPWAGWVKGLRQTWVYTPETKTFKIRKAKK